jgi:hypothetical protein
MSCWAAAKQGGWKAGKGWGWGCQAEGCGDASGQGLNKCVTVGQHNIPEPHPALHAMHRAVHSHIPLQESCSHVPLAPLLLLLLCPVGNWEWVQ